MVKDERTRYKSNYSSPMSKNSDRDIVILDTRVGNSNNKTSKDNESRRSGGGGNDSRNNLNKSSNSTHNNRDRSKSSNNRSYHHRDRGSDRPSHDQRFNGQHGPLDTSHSSSAGANNRGNQNTKFSGMAFTETELLTEIPKKKFTGRCRLFVGNLPNEVKESELKELFTPHGEISECYLSGKGFAFLRLDTRAHAESAKEALDGKTIHGRQVRVRFAVHGATIKVKELAPIVSNEMLHLTFSAFGEVERAVQIVDEKGKPTGEGIIEFERKASALDALNQIKERVFLMTANSRPLTAEMLEPRDEEDGLSEKMLQRTAQLLKERELGPRFAAINSFEFVFGQRWKELYELERKRRAEIELELKEARKRLEADMEIAYEDYKTQLLREDLQRRQQELERLEAAKRDRMRQVGVHSSSNIFGGGSGMPGLHHDPSALGDGPLGRNPPTFGVGNRPSGMFFGGNNGSIGPGVNGPPVGPPPSVAAARAGGPSGLGGLPPSSGLNFYGNGSQNRGLNPAEASKLADVQKLLQTFKGDQPPHRNSGKSMDYFMKNGPNDRPPPGLQQPGSNLPNHLLNIMGPFANALASGGPSPRQPPPGVLSDAFQPPEKRLRR